MSRTAMLGASLAVALLGSSVAHGEGLKSGPQVGSSKIPAFNPLHVNGPNADKKVCLV
jgi:hypothetical protein